MTADEEKPGSLISAMGAMEARLRQDNAAMEGRLRDSLSQMVTKDLFEAEQKYQGERHLQALERVKEERDRAEGAELAERSRAEGAEQELARQIEETQDLQGKAELARRASVRRLWAGILSGAGVLAALITALEQWLHLNR